MFLNRKITCFVIKVHVHHIHVYNINECIRFTYKFIKKNTVKVTLLYYKINQKNDLFFFFKRQYNNLETRLTLNRS